MRDHHLHAPVKLLSEAPLGGGLRDGRHYRSCSLWTSFTYRRVSARLTQRSGTSSRTLVLGQSDEKQPVCTLSGAPLKPVRYKVLAPKAARSGPLKTSCSNAWTDIPLSHLFSLLSVFDLRSNGTTASMSRINPADNTAVASKPRPAITPIAAVAQILAAVVRPST